MKTKKMLIDIDGVACAHAKAICETVNKEYKINSKYEDIIIYNYNFGPLTFHKAVDRYYPNELFIKSLRVTEGFKEFLAEASKITKVSFASARKHSKEATRWWINKNFGDKFSVYFVTNKVELNYDYLVDDYHEEVIKSAKTGKISFLISRPWNNNPEIKEALKSYPSAIFIDNFSDVIEFLHSKQH